MIPEEVSALEPVVVDTARPNDLETLKEYLKQVDVTSIAPATRLKFQEAVDALIALKEEIVEKKQGALDKKDFIKSKINDLKISGKVNIDDQEFGKSESSVHEFVRLLDTMVTEVERDITYYLSLLSDTPPAQIFAFKFESDLYEDHIKNKTQSIKKYVKTAKRDLSISYSRYCFGFDAQIRQITYVEQVLKYSREKPQA